MKILFAGGGTGGHFYPLIAVARSIYKIAEQRKIAKVDIFLMADDPMDSDLLFKEHIKFMKIPAGKIRRYFSLLNISDFIKTFFGIISSFRKIYSLLPDIVFSKGGYSSFPVLFSARLLKIPVIIHESDSVPGLVTTWSGKWADRVAISFTESGRFFDQKKIINSGNPIRSGVAGGNLEEAVQHFNLEENVSTILITGGSQGSEKINEAILSIIPQMVLKYQIIHQTGVKNFSDVSSRTKVILESTALKHRYHIVPFLSEGDLKNASRAASLVLSRASAGAIFEIAAWRLPSILIPLSNSAQNHQRENAYNYAKTGACEVLEENNLTPNILLAQIDKILNNQEKIGKMKEGAASFARSDSADIIAQEIINLGIHE